MTDRIVPTQMHTMITQILLTIPQAVVMSNIPRSGLYSALKLGKLTAVKAGRRTLIPVAELERYLSALPAYSTVA